MKSISAILFLSLAQFQPILAQDSTTWASPNQRISRLIFMNSASFLPGEVLLISGDDLIYTNDDYAFRGSVQLSLAGVAQLEIGNEGPIAAETGRVERLKTIGANVNILGDGTDLPAVAVNARSTLGWSKVSYDRASVSRDIGYLADQGMESFSYDYQYVFAGVTLSHRIMQIFEFTFGAGFQQFQLRNTHLYLTTPAPAESYSQAAGMVRINGISGFCGAKVAVSPLLTLVGEIDLIPEPTPIVETMKFDVDRALRLALGVRFFPTPHVGVHASIYDLVPTSGTRSFEARMGLDVFLHKHSS